MGQCQRSLDQHMCRLCRGRAPETVIEYQNITGVLDEQASHHSFPFSQQSVMSDQEASEARFKRRELKTLNDIYNKLEQLSRRVDDVKNHLSEGSQGDLKAELQDLVFKTQLINTKSKPNSGRSVVFHSQNIPPNIQYKKTVPKNDSTTIINRLNGLQSTVLDKLEARDFKKKNWNISDN